MVRCRVTGTVTLFLTATDEDEAIAKANISDFDDSEFDEWHVVEALEAELNE